MESGGVYERWMREPELKLHRDMKVLLVGSTTTLGSDIELMLAGGAHRLKAHLCTWGGGGLLLDPVLVLDVVRNAYDRLQLGHQLHPCLEKKSLASVTHASVTCRLNYCHAL